MAELNRLALISKGDSYCWKLENDIQEGEVRAKPWEVPNDPKDSAEIIADLEGYARRKFSVPEEVTVANNYDYRHLHQSLAMGVFYSFGKAFQEAVEGQITEDIGHMTGIC